MSDIVERLRWRAENTSTPTATTPMLCAEAADTITALRAALSTARADALEEAARVAEGEAVTAAGDEYQSDKAGCFWDRDSIYGTGRAEAAAAIRALKENN